MDRREFHRMAHQTDDVSRTSLEGTLRWGQSLVPSRMAVVPRGIDVRHLNGYSLRRPQSLHPDALFDHIPGFGDSGGSYGEATRPAGLASLMHVVQSNDHRIPMRQGRLKTTAVPTGFRARHPPRTTSYVGLIAPTLVGRPVMQFRGNNDRERRPEVPIVDLLDDDSADACVRSCREAHRPNAKTHELCFTTNGLMQMDFLPDRSDRRSVEATPLKDVSLGSLVIARRIGNAHLDFLNEGPSQSCEVINVISDEEEEAPAKEIANNVRGFERLRPLLNAIDMLSSRDFSDDGDASTTSRNAVAERRQRSLNDISHAAGKKREDGRDEGRNKRRKEEGNPYRKPYKKRRQREKRDNPSLWNFLAHGISLDSPQTAVAPPSIPRSTPSTVAIPGEPVRKTWFENLKQRDLQLLIEQHGLCGLAKLLTREKE